MLYLIMNSICRVGPWGIVSVDKYICRCEIATVLMDASVWIMQILIS